MDRRGRAAPRQTSAATPTSSAPSTHVAHAPRFSRPLADLHADQVGAERDPDGRQRDAPARRRGSRPGARTTAPECRTPRSCRTWRRWGTRTRCRSSRPRSRGSRASGPKSLRVQRYRPPAPGYFTESAATAMASGTMKSTAASSHSVTEPGPACAAAGNPARAHDAGDGEEREVAQAELALQLRARASSMSAARSRPAVRLRCGAVPRAEIPACRPARRAGSLPGPGARPARSARSGSRGCARRARSSGVRRLVAHQAQRARLRLAEGQEAAEAVGPFAA